MLIDVNSLITFNIFMTQKTYFFLKNKSNNNNNNNNETIKEMIGASVNIRVDLPSPQYLKTSGFLYF